MRSTRYTYRPAVWYTHSYAKHIQPTRISQQYWHETHRSFPFHVYVFIMYSPPDNVPYMLFQPDLKRIPFTTTRHTSVHYTSIVSYASKYGTEGTQRATNCCTTMTDYRDVRAVFSSQASQNVFLIYEYMCWPPFLHTAS